MSARAVLSVVVLSMLTALPARGQTPPAPTAPAVSPDDVDKAIKKAKDYLYAQQKDGIWEDASKRTEQPPKADWKWTANVSGGQWGGKTALAVLALLAGGESPQSDKLAPAVQFLMKADIIGTYALGVRC